MELIDKSALVAEIEKLKYVIMPYPTMAEKVAYRDGIEDTIKIVIKSLEEKGVDGICISNGAECGASIESSAGMLFLQHNTLDVGDKVKIIIVRED